MGQRLAARFQMFLPCCEEEVYVGRRSHKVAVSFDQRTVKKAFADADFVPGKRTGRWFESSQGIFVLPTF